MSSVASHNHPLDLGHCLSDFQKKVEMEKCPSIASQFHVSQVNL